MVIELPLAWSVTVMFEAKRRRPFDLSFIARSKPKIVGSIKLNPSAPAMK